MSDQPPSAAETEISFDVEGLLAMASRLDEGARHILASFDQAYEREAEREGASPHDVGIDSELYDQLTGRYAELARLFNNVLRSAKAQLPEPFILDIPEAPTDIHLRLLPVYSTQLSERLRALVRFKAKSYQKWTQFVEALRDARRTAGEAGSFIQRNLETLKKLADK